MSAPDPPRFVRVTMPATEARHAHPPTRPPTTLTCSVVLGLAYAMGGAEAAADPHQSVNELCVEDGDADADGTHTHHTHSHVVR